MILTEIREQVDILKKIKDVLDIAHFESDELQELCDNLSGADFTIELDDAEYRFIHDAEIEAIYKDSIRELVEECYLVGAKEFPWWIAIDWTQTAQNCFADGYGHHFSSYDGSELEIADYLVFRIN